MATGELRVARLATVEYRQAFALQQRLCAERQADAIPDTLLLLEHPPVYTRGRRTGPGELPMGEAWYLAHGIDIVDVDRGGKVTYHGPGQLVGYMIMRTDGVAEFVRRIEAALIVALRAEGLEAVTRNDEGRDFTGVWIQDRKVASIGIHVAKGVTTHGFAVNVTNDLQPFGWIIPCGLPEAQMTSVLKETGGDAGEGRLAAFAERMAAAFADEHDLVAVPLGADALLPSAVGR
jgi:lipoyl(octanoyl) transferase